MSRIYWISYCEYIRPVFLLLRHYRGVESFDSAISFSNHEREENTMRGYTDTNPQDEYARVTNLQNEGIACPYCHADSGHFGSCPILRRYESYREITEGYVQADGVSEKELRTVETYRKEFEPTINSITTEDSLRLHSLGVRWN